MAVVGWALEGSLEIWSIFLAMHGENLRQNTSRVLLFFLLGDPCVIPASPRESRKNTIYRVLYRRDAENSHFQVLLRNFPIR